MQPQMTRQQYRAARHVMRSLNRATRLECGSAQRLAFVGLAHQGPRECARRRRQMGLES